MVMTLTEAQKFQAFNAVCLAFDNCGSNADYHELVSCIEGVIYDDRLGDEGTLKAIFAEAVRVLEIDVQPPAEKPAPKRRSPRTRGAGR